MKIFLIIFCCAFALTLNAQNFKGQAVYMSKTTVDLDSWGGNKMSEQQKKMIMERMKSMFEKTYILNFTKSESLYKEDEQLEAPGSRGFSMMGSFTAGPQYKNLSDQLLIQEQEFFGKRFLITDALEQLQWKMTGETKKIGQYTVFKAVATKSVDEFDWRSMRRKKNDSEKTKDSTATKSNQDPFNQVEVPESIEITAWYTPQIPVSHGPSTYWGLPGLILEINADKTTILCKKIVINPQEEINIKKPEKGDIVTQSEYNKIIKKKMEEMREMYRGRRR
ncbi:MAG: GLPGLI family protein [Psychroflexus salarius]